jgi:hypothetical protein
MPVFVAKVLNCSRFEHATGAGEHSEDVRQEQVVAAVRRCNTASNRPKDGLVAVKIQYPDAPG